MISGFTVYLICRLNSIVCFFVASCWISAIVSVLSLIVLCATWLVYTDFASKTSLNDMQKTYIVVKRIWKIFFPVFLISSFFYIITPTSKELCAIIVVPKIANSIAENKQIQQLPDNIVGLANDWIKSLSPVQANVQTENTDKKK